jgi:hypothetical protein
MKKYSISTAVSAFVFLTLGLTSCKDACKNEMIYDANVPIYLSYEDLRKPVSTQSSETLEHPGKFWRKDGYLFVSDVNKGVHIYNVTNPSAPHEMVFVQVPGVMDVAVKGNYLLADSYTDLLVLDISNPNQPSEVKRLHNVFPYNAFKVEANMGFPVVAPDETKGVVIGWKVEQVKDEYACSGGKTMFMEGGLTNDVFTSNSSGVPSSFSGGGSMAAFAVKGDYLYTVDISKLHTYSIADAGNPSKVSEQSIGWNIETIIAHGRYLFIGTQTGLQIFGLQNAASPTYISGFSHATACDPVIVQDNLAYVTLRNGTTCNNASNQLDILNVQNINSPSLIRTYPMSKPHGLGIDGNILVVCEAEHGVKIFNAANPSNLISITTITSLNVTDVIMYNGLALFIGSSGIWVYTYDASGNFQAGGSIAIVG